jgi:hypothetical protein
MKMKIQPTTIFRIQQKAVLGGKFVALRTYIKKQNKKTQRNLKKK